MLFVCVHNAGRSQMAAGLVKLRSEGRIHVRSAGSDPTDEINPAVVEAMNEIGVDMSEEFPKPLTDEVVRAADVVITMGCGDACPIYPGKTYEDWKLDDPAGQGPRRPCARSATRSTRASNGSSRSSPSRNHHDRRKEARCSSTRTTAVATATTAARPAAAESAARRTMTYARRRASVMSDGAAYTSTHGHRDAQLSPGARRR